MAFWLFKQEPARYSFADLERDGSTVWDGVTNALARQHLRQVKPGDRVLFYHTGTEKAVVGEMKVLTAPAADPNSDDAKSVVVAVEPVRRLAQPVALAQIKADQLLAACDLVRLPRLSVVPIAAAHWQRIEELARG